VSVQGAIRFKRNFVYLGTR